MASPIDESPAVQIRPLQTENCRLQTENDLLHSEKSGSPEIEEELANYDLLRPENCYYPLDEAFLVEMEKVAEKEAEMLWGEETDVANSKKELDAGHDQDHQAVNPKEKKDQEDDEDDTDRLRLENRRLKSHIAFLKEDERAAATVQFQLEIENASLRMERDDMREALELAVAQCESLRLELDEKKRSDADADEKFAQLVEAWIARDRAVEKMEDCMAHNKRLEERLGRHERAVRAVRERALRMLERVKKLADDDDNDTGEAKAAENEEMEVDEKWIGVLMRPLEEEMEKIESSFRSE